MVSHVHIIPYTYADYNTLSGHYPCALNTGLDDFIAKSTPIRAVAGDLFNTTYGNGWYYFADKSANTPETYGLCFFLNINNWSFRLAIGTSKFAYTNVNIGQGFGTWLKL